MATPSREEPDGLFDIDEIDGNSPPPEKQCSQSPEQSTDKASTTTGINEEIELSRRAVPVVEVEEDVCSICLDEFTTEDPEQRTSCEHRYHLQCIMQWAQRSRECPMCFKALQLQDEAMNELLPFGEYVPPERLAAAAPHFMVGLDAWELEHLLHRLAAANTMGGVSARRDRRRHRSHAHASSSVQDRHSVDGEGPAHDSGHVHSRQPAAGTGSSRPDGDANGIPDEAAIHPSSWPPPSQRNLMPQSPPGELRSPHARGMGMDLQGLRSRLAGIKDTFANTTRSLKGRWGGHRGACDHNGHHQNHHQHQRGGSPPSTPSASSSAHVNGPQRATSS
ncbi:g8866 [Coccomyxa elongata]